MKIENDSLYSKRTKQRGGFSNRIGKKANRKIKARKEKEDKSVWFGLGMFGLVGWAVSIPTLLFLAIGIWIDSMYESQYSWTLMFLIIGVILGCLNAWFWVKKESRYD